MNSSNSAIDFLTANLPPNLGGTAPENPAPAPVADTPTPAAPEPTPVLEKPAAEPKPVVTPTLKRGIDALTVEEPEAEEPEAKAEPEKDDTPTDAKTPEARNAWSSIKSELKEAKAALAALEAEKAELAKSLEANKGLAANDPLVKEFETVKSRNEELERIAYMYKTEQSAAYQKAVQQPYDELMSEVDVLAKRYEVNAAQIEDALQETDHKRRSEKLSEIMDGMDEFDKAAVRDIARGVQKIQATRQNILKNAAESWKEAQEQEVEAAKQRTTAIRAEEMRAVEELKTSLSRASKLFALEGEDGDTAVSKILQEANEVPFDEQDAKQKAFAAVSALMVPRMVNNLNSLHKEIAGLKKELAAYSKVGAKASDGSRPTAPTQATPQGGFDAVMAAIQRDLANIGVQ